MFKAVYTLVSIVKHKAAHTAADHTLVGLVVWFKQLQTMLLHPMTALIGE